MLNLNIIDGLFGALMETAFGKTADAFEKRKAFKQDLLTFLHDQQKHTSLDVFLFSRRPKYGTEENPEDFLTLEEIYIPLRLNQLRSTLPDFQKLRQTADGQDDLTDQKIEDLHIGGLLDLMQYNEHFRQVMIIGQAGSGKSTFMKYLTRLLTTEKPAVKVIEKNENDEANETAQPISFKAVPVFVRLRDLEGKLRENGQAEWENHYSMESFVAELCGQRFDTPNFPGKLFRELPCIFLFDGIDEVPENKTVDGVNISRPKVISWLLRQMEHLRRINPEARFVLTSRPTDTGALARHFQIFETQKFDTAEIDLFTEYWYRGCEKTFRANAKAEYLSHKKEKWQSRCNYLPDSKANFQKNVKNEPLKSIVDNPLLLSLALFMHVIDQRFSTENRENLYQRFCEAFLYEWDEVRDMDFYPALFGRGHYERLFEVTFRLALHFSENNTTKMTVRELLPAVQKAVSRYPLPTETPMEEHALELLRAFDNRNGLLTGRTNSDDFLDTEFEFQHKSFQDYLAAQCISQDRLIERSQFSFVDKLDADFWQRTLEFYVNLSSPDLFFEQTIALIEPDHPIVGKLHYFVQHFLHARQKDPALTTALAEKVWEVFIKSDAARNIFIASQCLHRLPETRTEVMFELVRHRHSDELNAFRAGKAVWLLYKKGHYAELRNVLVSKIADVFAAPREYDFIDLSQWQLIPFWDRDMYTLRCFLSSLHEAGRPCQAFGLLMSRDLHRLRDMLGWPYLRDLLELLDWPDWWDMLSWLDWQNLLEFHDWSDFSDLSDWRYWRDLAELRDLRDLRGWRGWRNLRDWRNLHSHLSIDFQQIDTNLERVISKLDNLTPEEEARLFKPYPPLETNN